MTMIACACSPSAMSRPATNGAAFARVEDAPDDAFAKLALLVYANDRLIAELRAIRQRVERASAYAKDPTANPSLANACLERLRARRSRVLVLLRANRLAAEAFLSA